MHLGPLSSSHGCHFAILHRPTNTICHITLLVHVRVPAADTYDVETHIVISVAQPSFVGAETVCCFSGGWALYIGIEYDRLFGTVIFAPNALCRTSFCFRRPPFCLVPEDDIHEGALLSLTVSLHVLMSAGHGNPVLYLDLCLRLSCTLTRFLCRSGFQADVQHAALIGRKRPLLLQVTRHLTPAQLIRTSSTSIP
ncbi:uncharacterized protein ARMOST_14972 [Armillaria ostoyae]|uniref:Uncharacterized protein n=1 Tax=Armillaria ostoyae TaxID=47428 RepID=A0A284RS27_ARMOS|nr:uncharacterized protein ARMOST_14972 [Armillaria ostoyae]